MSPKLTANEFETFARIMRGLCGVTFEPHVLDAVERRLSERLSELGLSSYPSYWLRLSESQLEQDWAYDALMIKETYFFRQDYQLDAFKREVLPELIRQEGQFRRITVWSAGCSSGEEAYTLAILLSESAAVTGYRNQVVGTDLCRSNVEAATRGEYRSSAFRASSVEDLSRYVEPLGKHFRVREPLRKMCHFQRGNLLNENDVRLVGRVDAIFCRNVLIYMDEASRMKVLAALYERLLPGGYLFLGHAESLLNLDTQFEPVHLSTDLVYRRPLARSLTQRPSQRAGV